MVLLADSHGHIDPAWDEHLLDCDEIWHAGDFGLLAVAEHLEKRAPLVGVFGNIDGPDIRQRFPEHQRFQREGIRIWMTHIGGQPRKLPRPIAEALKADPPDLFICGHSHLPKAERDPLGVFHLNPGAAGRQGFHHTRTLMLLTLEARRVSRLKLVELGPR